MSSKQLSQLTQCIKDWNTNLEYFKKIMDDGTYLQHIRKLKAKIGESTYILIQTIDKINDLSMEIMKKLELTTTWPHDDQVKAKKFQNDFNNKRRVYITLLQQHRQKKTIQLAEVRESLNSRRESIQGSRGSRATKRKRDQQDSDQVKIQLQDVNQQTLFQQHMLQLKQKQLLEVKNKMEIALEVQKQMGKLVDEQGRQIDIIDDNIDSARSNVKQAGTLLEQGVDNHKAANKKKMCIIAIIFVILLIIIVPIMIKFAF